MFKMLQVRNGELLEGAVLIGRIVCFGFLAGFTVSDIRFRKVSTSWLAMGGVMAAVYCLVFQREQWILSAMGLLTGALFILISRLTGEGIGYGDSIMISILGLYLGIWSLLEMLVITWCLVAIAAMIILVKKKYARKAAIPLMPFIMMGYVVMWGSEVFVG